MASKKQIILPIAVLIAGVGISAAFSAMKKPPEEKAEKVIHPLVEVQAVTVAPMQLSVDSYGIVKPKYTTSLVAQVNGQIIQLSERFVRGGFVKAGEILARIDPNDYEAALIEAQANLAQASSALEIEQAQAHVAKTEWQRIKNNTNETIPSELYLRKPQLAEKLAQYRAAQASEKRAKRNLERTYIKAPYDAIIESREVSLGSVVSPGSQFGVLNATSVAEIRLPVADKDLQYLVNNGIDAPVTLAAKFAGKSVTWNGKVVRSEGVIDERSRMTYLVAQVDIPYGLTEKPLRFGTYLNAKIEGQLLQSAVAVPRHLVNDGKIATLQEDSTLAFKPLNIVREANGFVIADQGLNDGNRIITSALEYPSDGMTVRIENTLLKSPETQLALKKE
ncbi:efflux RND transporter periplasmic adaptor subunit [Pseudoalteromonas citrea]|uniref:Efflux RND transporter periplasmic adaptor subunit n=1 Tax=Pseudoalteromonas citrea TaxID=43655 RepID=A0A5S3XNG2_9GAMM|nr:efflux RND transporter periplasmic adaptor subunit [Pseudoalteromonas citrea]TMP42966.1 efflux RND transporter periplasmic adaptor subunit [Pseudoalteromonas citrea]TMP58471.1 efflux RND transporter periplasmic adaptor subunit [Pseudoalteromonas citrea]